MLTDPALTGMSRSDFAHLVAVSEPYWDALAEAAFQRRFHRPRSYLHPQVSSLDHFHRLLTALLRRRQAATSTLLAQLLGVTRTNLSNQFQDGHRLLDLHRIAITPIPGSPAAPVNNCRPAFRTASRSPQINPDSYSFTSPRPHRELSDWRVHRLRHHTWTRPGDRELYLPKSWTDDRDRCRAAHIPDERAFATKPDLAKAMVLRAIASPLPIAWVTADAAYGQEWRLRRMLEETGLGYVLSVPKSQQVPHFGRIDHLFSQAPNEAWERRSCGDGAKGPRVYHWAALQITCIEDFEGEMPTHQRWALARRSISKPEEIAYYLAYAPLGTTVEHLVRVAGIRWAIEEAFQAAKNECGLDQYEVRRYTGWMRHITLAMLAHAFLAVMAADAAAKGAAETVPASASRPSPWQKFGGSWQLATHSHVPTSLSSAHAR
ncbi:IS701 family transposase [Streptomyces sp. NPDC051636]|uniref:IS701 family transposase n=1 Tax=Streptomyces sp. NPDC051636 TaxID=3365663 RepID=UPI0037B8D3B6